MTSLLNKNVGAKITNALSTWFEVETYRKDRLGDGCKVRFDEGICKKGISIVMNKSNKRGTKLSFLPSKELMGEITLTCEDVLTMMTNISFLGKLGKVIEFHGIRRDGKVVNKDVINERGILIDLDRIQSPLFKLPVILKHDDGTNKAEIAFNYDLNDIYINEDNIHSYANYSPTVNTKSSHFEGFMDGMCQWVTGYMNRVYLASANTKAASKGKNKNKIVVNSQDVKMGLKGIISTCCLYPIFGGQAKDTIKNPDLKIFVKTLVINGMNEWAKSNPGDLSKLCGYIKEVAKSRISQDKEKVKIGSKYESNALSGGLPAKYIRPTGSKNLGWEFIIVEGDSALSGAKNTRKKSVQGILPIRGKLPNVFKMTKANKSKFLNNAEIQGMIAIISNKTMKWGENFKPEDTPFKKIIIMSDRDSDGDHIATLLIKFFIKFYPQLVEAGMIYRAMPPLYGLKKKDGSIDKFFGTRAEYNEWLFKNFSKTNKIQKVDGKKLTPSIAIDILAKNEDYLYDFDSIGTTFAVDKILLEQIIFNIVGAKMNSQDLFKYMKKNISKDKRFRFLNVIRSKSGFIGIEGEYNQLIQSIYLTPQILQEFQPLIEHVKNNVIWNFILNGNHVSLYELLSAFQKSSPSNLTRYKGLGEMKPADLQLSTLHPDMERTLIRYNFANAAEAIKKMRYYETDKSRLLEGRRNTREDLIG